MSTHFLRVIASRKLPINITNSYDIDQLRSLTASGYVEAVLPVRHGEDHYAVVSRITRRGWEVLEDSLDMAPGEMDEWPVA
ncbi:hypothetical protein [Polaromonas sp. UC242_47]|uniref:hypothetical protein n=1 Tax=Polaromonas sp. UC242_47 TaxID=3374626 RepID=UPI0037B2C379